jgi:UDP-N-acetylglucosamine 2-epimerase (non-hydrolysing)
MFPILRLFDSKSIDYKYIHTGQHYNHNLFLNFIKEFGIRKPHHTLSIAKSNPIDQIASVIKQVALILNKLRPSVVLVEGDTNSVLASALGALKTRIPIAHVEAGLRSNDWRTVEEHNRRIVDNISDFLFSPTAISSKNLRNEQVHGRIYTVGNTIMDAINYCLGEQFDDSVHELQVNKLFLRFGIGLSNPNDFILVTFHRSENVDSMSNLKHVLRAISESKLNYVFPMHPRTYKRIREYGLTKYLTKGIKVINPVGYLAFLRLLMNCRFVITDSGGVQEEVTSPKINKRCIVLRYSTERPESVASGHCVLCPVEHKSIINKIEEFNSANVKYFAITRSPYGNGDKADKIYQILEKSSLF